MLGSIGWARQTVTAPAVMIQVLDETNDQVKHVMTDEDYLGNVWYYYYWRTDCFEFISEYPDRSSFDLLISSQQMVGCSPYNSLKTAQFLDFAHCIVFK
jgi:hypothetical protein